MPFRAPFRRSASYGSGALVVNAIEVVPGRSRAALPEPRRCAQLEVAPAPSSLRPVAQPPHARPCPSPPRNPTRHRSSALHVEPGGLGRQGRSSAGRAGVGPTQLDQVRCLARRPDEAQVEQLLGSPVPRPAPLPRVAPRECAESGAARGAVASAPGAPGPPERSEQDAGGSVQ